MAIIKVDPDKLESTSQTLSDLKHRVTGLGGELMQISGSAPAYQGQFSPRVLGLSAQANLKVLAQVGKLDSQSSRLSKTAKRFREADASLDRTGGWSDGIRGLLDKLGGVFGGLSPWILGQIGLLGSLGSLFLIPTPWNPSPVYGADGNYTESSPRWSIWSVRNYIGGFFRDLWNKLFGKDPNNTEPIQQGQITEQAVKTEVEPALLPKSPFSSGWRLTGSFGLYFNDRLVHNGLDLAPIKPSDLSIHSIGPGKVVQVRTTTDKDGNIVGFGHQIVVEHKLADGRIIRSNYAHMKSPSSLKVGDQVSHESELGQMGSSGNSTGAHLHLDIHDVQKKTEIYYKQIKSSSVYKPTDPIGPNNYGIPESTTFIDEVKLSWIDPSKLLDSQNSGAYQFIPVDQW